MRPASEDHQRRYRRRILGLGAALFVVLFVIPAPFVLGWVEDDLEHRVGDALGDAGIAGVTVRFSGQDGTLTCADPLEDPERAERIAEAEWGVRIVDLDRSCRADDTGDTGDTDGAGPGTSDPDADGTGGATTAPSTEVPPTATAPTTTVVPDTSSSSTIVEPELGSIVSIVEDDPQFSQLAGLFAISGVDETLAGARSFTLFAPTDAAFDAAFESLGPDAFADLTSDPATAERLVLHLATDGAIASTALEPGDLGMLDGSPITVARDADGVLLSSGGATARLDPDVVDVAASNGVVHAIDTVLLPDDLELGDDVAAEPEVTIEFDDGVFTYTGVVASAGQRQALLGPIDGEVEPANVEDRLNVTVDGAPADDDVARLARLIEAVPGNLVSATITLTEGDLVVTGLHLGVERLAAFEAVAGEVGAALELSERPVADEAAAAALQEGLEDLVRAEPIEFEQSSAELAPGSAAVVERIAARVSSLTGISVVVVGHTDSDGDPARNQQLSEERAAAVREALVAEGVDPAVLEAEGRGQREPVLVDGVEDKAASRRVEFVVVAVT